MRQENSRSISRKGSILFFQRIYEDGLAQASYLIGCQETGTALVIDPKRDIDTYLEIADRENLRITHITETHIHADFLSGARELAAATGAELLLSAEGGSDWLYGYDHIGLKDGDLFKFGNIKVEVMHTPGHTPEHISFLVNDMQSGDVPVMFFSGDFVFVGSVGRPDLLEKAAGIAGTQEQGARQLFQSLKKFKALPDHVQVIPGHGAGSACGKALGAVPATTVGSEKLVNWALQDQSEEEFVETLLDGQPEVPAYFSIMKRLNKQGPDVLGGLPSLKKLGLDELNKAIDSGLMMIDARDKLTFSRGHIPGSINIQNTPSFSNWTGWFLDYTKPFVLVTFENQSDIINRKLIRVGLDLCLGYFIDVKTWRECGNPLEQLEQVEPQTLQNLAVNNQVQILDIRARSEYEIGHIPGAEHIHLGRLEDYLDRLPGNRKIVLHCKSGDRSSIGCSFLQSKGIKNIANLTGGITAWKKAGYEVVKER